MPDLRRSWGLKYSRAVTHFDLLVSDLENYQAGFTSHVINRNQGDEVVVILQSVGNPLPDAITSVVGDCIQNFRSSLDHIVWRLASDGERQHHPTRPAFPIEINPEDFHAKGRHRIQSLREASKRMIEEQQPYATNPAQPDEEPIAFLELLSNIDKHRRIHFANPTFQFMSVLVGSNVVPVSYRAQPGERIRPGLVLARVKQAEIRRLAPSGTGVLSGGLTMTIAFDEADQATGRGVIGTLRSIKDTVGEVLNRLEPYIEL